MRVAWNARLARATPVAMLLLGLCLLPALARPTGSGPPEGPGAKQVWKFDSDPVGVIPPGFIREGGKWVVVADGENRVLAQTEKNNDDAFNLALVEGTSFRDVDVSVRLRALKGDVDQGGGLVWRAKDGRNYYLARYNPLEDNYRVYKVVDGRRTMFKGVKVVLPPGWHVVRVTMAGDRIRCYLDGKEHMDVSDATFGGPGKIGVWSKADAQSYFDDLTAGDVVPAD